MNGHRMRDVYSSETLPYRAFPANQTLMQATAIHSQIFKTWYDGDCGLTNSQVFASRVGYDLSDRGSRSMLHHLDSMLYTVV